MSRKSAGRPKKAGVRKPCGRLREITDQGTIELMTHRASRIDPILAKRCLDEITSSPTDKERNQAMSRLASVAQDRRAASVLGTLLARRIINGAQHSAGVRYAALYRQAVNRIGAPKGTLGKLIGGSPGEGIDISEDVHKAYVEARKKLRWRSERVAVAVERAAVFDEIPSGEEIDRLRIGLNALREHFDR